MLLVLFALLVPFLRGEADLKIAEHLHKRNVARENVAMGAMMGNRGGHIEIVEESNSFLGDINSDRKKFNYGYYDSQWFGNINDTNCEGEPFMTMAVNIGNCYKVVMPDGSASSFKATFDNFTFIRNFFSDGKCKKPFDYDSPNPNLNPEYYTPNYADCYSWGNGLNFGMGKIGYFSKTVFHKGKKLKMRKARKNAYYIGRSDRKKNCKKNRMVSYSSYATGSCSNVWGGMYMKEECGENNEVWIRLFADDTCETPYNSGSSDYTMYTGGCSSVAVYNYTASQWFPENTMAKQKVYCNA